MATYLVLNCLLTLVVLVLALQFGRSPFNRYMLFTALIVIGFTAIFDPIIVNQDLVRYNPEKILGITIGKAPIEDLFYALIAGVLIPTVWVNTGRHKKELGDERKN